jgi:molecular chaperone DnaK
MNGEPTIGIDLGTSNSCVASLVGGQPAVLPNAEDSPISASVVAFHADGTTLVGNRAKAEIILDPVNTVSSAKRLIGRYFFSEEVRKARAICRYQIVQGENHSVRIRIRDTEYSLPEISALVLREMKQIAERRLGREVSRAVITVPAYFNDNQRQATKDAGRIAGLEVLRILNEPTAAALAYGYGRRLNQKVAVYDLGGGTFDVSVLEIGEDVFEVLSTCGDTYLGGDDFDDRLIDLFAEGVQSKHGVNVRSNVVALERLKCAAEQAKIALSSQERVDVRLPDLFQVNGRSMALEYSLSREDFNRLTFDLVQRTFNVCDEALQQAGLTTRDLDGVILVGGSTRMLNVRQAVRQYFQREPEIDINPDEVVAIGAAIHADSLVSERRDTYLLDVTPLTLRIGIAGGLTQPIIERNSPVPIDHTRGFTTARDHQQSISVRVYQGEARAATENALLGEFEFSDFEPGLRGQVQIDVTFAINTEGIVRVTARDRKTGAAAHTTVSMSSGLSEQEIQAIIARSRETGGDDSDAPLPLPESRDDDDGTLLEMPDVQAVRAALGLDANSEDPLGFLERALDADDELGDGAGERAEPMLGMAPGGPPKDEELELDEPWSPEGEPER